MNKIVIGRSARPVAIWLLIGVFMIIIQIILGGITRLTDSGLSITEWKPILGTLPPMNEHEWQKAFDNYKHIAQYKHLHFYFSLQDFKSIYFWEWLHRNWGRFMGLVFFIPFIVFISQKRIQSSMIRPLIILFLLGGLQGLIGWVMVQSGLNEEDLYVSHIRLCIHFLAALLLLVNTFWFSLKLLEPGMERIKIPSLKKFTIVILVLLVVQLAFGAFMAGLKAAVAAPTWPDINGSYSTGDIVHYRGRTYSWLSSIVNHPIGVQFIHRNLAYLIFILIIAWTIRAANVRTGSLLDRVKWLPLLFVTIQVILGIASLLTSPTKVPQQWGVFEWNALIHQFVAIMLLISLVLVLFLISSNKKLIQSIHLNNR
ncbi:MAG: COX15/CtaA family protein [Flavisolibacter sp.]